MSMDNQLKLGPELLDASRESWISYYVFAFLSIAVLGGGYFVVRRSGVQGADYWLLLGCVLLFSLICGGICIVCHLFGHLFDMLKEMQQSQMLQIQSTEPRTTTSVKLVYGGKKVEPLPGPQEPSILQRN